ncbi:MAG: SCO family protein [Cryomorphaceae bacterium]|jgi:protein SCO1/2|nr:SCO family protein [Cryomorphaceae bacterium]MBT3503490.1 SCO family protein [Cryomorphaceae bacterium]MBT3688919.1 SCO family protein [Cryomorphaceae bacterium]MBT4222506.1 SCO family protein [Cryomorphaceae bacterium]MBT4293529.1 SCO family protein [Cryomorphaceae bacterium]|tara:strand:- start:123 stop:782 length:660 start_codon:yes stop_codon:yes gene_type:complete
MLKKYGLFVATMLSISIASILMFNYVLSPEKKLPIYQPSMVKFQLVDSTVQHVKRFHKIVDFELTNQNNKIITNKIYDGKIYIADFFFTTCPGICPIMTDNMITIQEKFLNDDQVLLLSHTVTPEIDSVSVLKKYSIEKGVDDSKWNMVTGDKKQIYNLARKSYLVAEDIEGSKFYDMIHTENFVLVDSKRRIRGFYDGTDTESMNQLIDDVYILKKEF